MGNKTVVTRPKPQDISRETKTQDISPETETKTQDISCETETKTWDISRETETKTQDIQFASWRDSFKAVNGIKVIYLYTEAI